MARATQTRLCVGMGALKRAACATPSTVSIGEKAWARTLVIPLTCVSVLGRLCPGIGRESMPSVFTNPSHNSTGES